MTIKYVAELNEVEQQAVVEMVYNVAQEMFLDKEETNEALENALNSKVSDLGDLLETNGVESVQEAVEKFVSKYYKLTKELAELFGGACDTFETGDMIISFENGNEIEVAIREGIVKVYGSNEGYCYHDEIYTNVDMFKKEFACLCKISR